MSPKQDLVERLIIEINANKKFTQKAIEFAQEGKVSKAWGMLDIAKEAKDCAEQIHKELWEVSNGELTEKEFELFSESETLYFKLREAVKVVKAAMKN